MRSMLSFLYVILCLHVQTITSQVTTTQPQLQAEYLLKQYRDLSDDKFKEFLIKNSNNISNNVLFEILGIDKQSPDSNTISIVMNITNILDRPIVKAYCFFKTGDMYIDNYNYDLAYKSYNIALEQYLKISHNMGIGWCLLYLGDIYKNTNRIDSSLIYYRIASLYFVKDRDTAMVATALKNMATCYEDLHKLDSALILYDQASQLYILSGDSIGLGNTFRSMGEFYSKIGNENLGIQYINQALKCYKATKDTIGLGNVYYFKAEKSRRVGDYASALNYLDTAEYFYNSKNRLISINNVKSGRATIFSLQNKYDESIKQFELVVTNGIKLNEPLSIMNALNDIAYTLIYKKQFNKAQIYFDSAYTIAKRFQSLSTLRYIFFGKGLSYDSLGKYNEADDAFENGLQYASLEVNSSNNLHLRNEIHKQQIGLYKYYVSYLLKHNKNERAFEVFENMKGKMFIEQLESAKQSQYSKLDFISKNKVDSLIKLKEHYKIRTINRLMEDKNDSLTDALFNEIARIDEKINFIVLNGYSIQYSNNNNDKVNITKVQKVIQDNECVVEYIINDNSAFVLLIEKNSYSQYELKLPGKSYFDLIEMHAKDSIYYDYLETNPLKKNYSINNENIGGSLFETLISPFYDKVATKKLIIIPDNELGYIPFESLVHNKSGMQKYLIETNEVVYYQSSSVLVHMREKEKSNKKDVLLIGDPVYDYKHFENNEFECCSEELEKSSVDTIMAFIMRRDFINLNKLPRLEGSGLEIKSIDSLCKLENIKSDLYQRLKASESELNKIKLSNFGFIHFACHGFANNEFQGIVLSILPTELSREDGLYTFDDIISTKLNSRLITFSACQSGLGSASLIDGISNLSRAAMIAGSDASVVSLWNVNDIGASKIMYKMYKYIFHDNLPISTSLRKAKLDMINEKDSTWGFVKHPNIWSVFVMYGE